MALELKTIRKDLRKKRRQLTTYQQKQAAQQVLNQLRQHHIFKNSQNIGLYLSAFGEIQTKAIIEYCFLKRKKVFLPLICNMNQKLVWISISKYQYRNKRFIQHSLGMQEPIATRGKHVATLDLLLMPLLACDTQGSRVGMGGGFYDRTLADAPKKPFRLGIAHHFQFIHTSFTRQPWDQALDALVTPEMFLRFQR